MPAMTNDDLLEVASNILTDLKASTSNIAEMLTVLTIVQTLIQLEMARSDGQTA